MLDDDEPTEEAEESQPEPHVRQAETTSRLTGLLNEEEAKAEADEEKTVMRRVEMPVSLWEEVLLLARTTGVDHRDILGALVDMGIQAQTEGRIKPRTVPVENKLWDRIKAANLSGTTDQEALAYLVDLGLQTDTSKRVGDAVAVPLRSTLVMVDQVSTRGNLKRLGEFHSPNVPGKGDSITVGGEHYYVSQLAWVMGENPKLYLRVKRYGVR